VYAICFCKWFFLPCLCKVFQVKFLCFLSRYLCYCLMSSGKTNKSDITVRDILCITNNKRLKNRLWWKCELFSLHWTCVEISCTVNVPSNCPYRKPLKVIILKILPGYKSRFLFSCFNFNLKNAPLSILWHKNEKARLVSEHGTQGDWFFISGFFKISTSKWGGPEMKSFSATHTSSERRRRKTFHDQRDTKAVVFWFTTRFWFGSQ